MSHSTQKQVTFEAKILRFVCAVGAVRMLYEFYLIFFVDSASLFVFSDVLLFCLFSFGAIVTFYPIPLEWITVPFSLFIILLLSYSWINTGGIEGVSEYNFLGLIALVGLINSGRFMYGFVILTIFIEAILLWFWHFNFSSIQFLISDQYTMDPEQFVSTILAFTVSMLYLMYQYDLNRFKLKGQKMELGTLILEAKSENKLILERKVELGRINAELDKKIAFRKSQLNDRSVVLKKFLGLTINEFQPPLDSMKHHVNEIDGDSEHAGVIKLLKSSLNQLDLEYKKIVNQNIENQE